MLLLLLLPSSIVMIHVDNSAVPSSVISQFRIKRSISLKLQKQKSVAERRREAKKAAAGSNTASGVFLRASSKDTSSRLASK